MIICLATPKLCVIKKVIAYHPLFKPNILLSYGSGNSDTNNLLKFDRNLVGIIMFDSGTWTLNHSCPKTQAKITFGGYQNHMKGFSHNYNGYFNFDEKHVENRSFDINRDNQERLEAAGLKPIYVLHSTSGEEVDYCLEQKYDYVAVGSSSLNKKENTEKIVNLLFEKGIKTHLFGFTKYDIMKSIPVYSCDSSTWTKTANDSDAILYWNPHYDKPNKIHIETKDDASTKGKYSFQRYPFRKELEQYLWNTLRFKYSDLLGVRGRDNRRAVNMYYYIKLEERLTKMHLEQGFPW